MWNVLTVVVMVVGLLTRMRRCLPMMCWLTACMYVVCCLMRLIGKQVGILEVAISRAGYVTVDR